MSLLSQPQDESGGASDPSSTTPTSASEGAAQQTPPLPVGADAAPAVSAATPPPAPAMTPEIFPGQSPSQPWQGYPPGQPYYPGYPPTLPPSQPYPPQGYPGTPSQPYLPPGYPGAASQPYYPGQPNMSQPWMGYPTVQQMPWPDTIGGVATMAPPTPKPAGFTALAQPLPLWAILSGCAVVVLVLLGLFLMGSDWADGAMHVGIATGALALLVILATGIRSLAGMAAPTNALRQAQYIGASVVTVLFLIVSGAGIGLQSPIHRLQANVLESSQRWQQAINELQLAGETPPASEALAAVYDAWGEHLSTIQQYQKASDTFFLVVDTYRAAPNGVKRAQADIVTTTIAWGKYAVQQHNYQEATTEFDFALTQPGCDSNCLAQVNALDATAYYDLAEADISSQHYTDAITAFAAITTRFPTSPEAHKLHGDYAGALYQAGQQDIANAGTCQSAIPLYQQLTKDFADTPQAKQAATALAAPQRVIGQFSSGPPTNTTGVVSLLKNAHIDLATQDFAGTPTDVANALIKSDGSFTLPPVPQGTYGLAWETADKSGNLTSLSFYYVRTTGDPYYLATVGQLCPFDFGAIGDPIYSPNNNTVIEHESLVATMLGGHNVLVTTIGVAAPRERRLIGVK